MPTNPDKVVLRVKDPSGTEAMISAVSNPKIGTYMALFAPNMPGIWYLRWEGTGLVQAAIENQFEVRPSAFSNAQ